MMRAAADRIPARPLPWLHCSPLARHNSNASCLYSSVYLALLRAGFALNCDFGLWAPHRVLTLSPLSDKSMQALL